MNNAPTLVLPKNVTAMRSKSTGQVGTERYRHTQKATGKATERAPQRQGGNGGLLELLTQRRAACSHSLLLSQLTFSHLQPPESPTILSPQTHREALDHCYAACSCRQYKQSCRPKDWSSQAGIPLILSGWTRATGANKREGREKSCRNRHTASSMEL